MLTAYIKDKYTLLFSFKLLPKHVLLLLSNQVVQICDDMFKFRNCANNVNLQNPLAAATRYSWVTLQALGTMDCYLREKFCQHQVINSTFIWFLMHHMADQTAVGLKAMVDSLKSSAPKLKENMKEYKADGSKKITQEMYNRLDSNLEFVIRANNLKKSCKKNSCGGN